MSKKQCTVCKEHKNVDEFYIRNGTPRAACKQCTLVAIRSWQRREDRHYRASQKAKNSNIRARRLNVPGKLTTQQVLDLFESQNDTCLACGLIGDLTLDHVIPLTDPRSTNLPENTQGLCRHCNLSKQANDTDYRPHQHQKAA